jgi:uncharacterized protein (TIGR03086 family)
MTAPAARATAPDIPPVTHASVPGIPPVTHATPPATDTIPPATPLPPARPIPAVRLHEKAITGLTALIAAIEPDQWTLRTPCPDWDVRDLVAHLIAEARWAPPLLAGLTIAEVGSSLDAPLDPDPVVAWSTAQRAALRAAQEPHIQESVVHVSDGDIPAAEYLRQLTADYLIHGWDLAITLGLDDTLDPELVDVVQEWFPSQAAAYRTAGMISAPAAVTDDDPQTLLLAEFGRSRETEATRATIARFGNAFDRADVDAVMASMTSDCVFESTSPPDGQRHEGQQAVRQAWTDFFAASRGAVFETEELVISGDRAIARWRYTWAPGANGHVRGIDLFRVRGRLVAEKLSYVKG